MADEIETAVGDATNGRSYVCQEPAAEGLSKLGLLHKYL